MAFDQTQTPEFKRWFRASKVVDAQGRPLRVYHGTSATFDAFSRSGHYADNDGFYFTTEPKHASAYAGHRIGSSLLPVFLSIKRPLRMTSQEWYDNQQHGRALGDQADWIKAGYDGLFIKKLEQQGGKSDTYVAFYPQQIKSAIGNRGTFDPKDPDMRNPKEALDRDGNPLADMDGVPMALNADGTVTLYHRTTPQAAKAIKQTGRWISKENTDETFFSNKREGQAEGYGDAVVVIRISPRRVRINDAFHHGEIHVAVPNRFLSGVKPNPQSSFLPPPKEPTERETIAFPANRALVTNTLTGMLQDLLAGRNKGLYGTGYSEGALRSVSDRMRELATQLGVSRAQGSMLNRIWEKAVAECTNPNFAWIAVQKAVREAIGEKKNPPRRGTSTMTFTRQIADDKDLLDTACKASIQHGGAWVWRITPFSHETKFLRYDNPSSVPDAFHDLTRGEMAWQGKIRSFTHASVIREQNRGLGPNPPEENVPFRGIAAALAKRKAAPEAFDTFGKAFELQAALDALRKTINRLTDERVGDEIGRRREFLDYFRKSKIAYRPGTIREGGTSLGTEIAEALADKSPYVRSFFKLLQPGERGREPDDMVSELVGMHLMPEGSTDEDVPNAVIAAAREPSPADFWGRAALAVADEKENSEEASRGEVGPLEWAVGQYHTVKAELETLGKRLEALSGFRRYERAKKPVEMPPALPPPRILAPQRLPEPPKRPPPMIHRESSRPKMHPMTRAAMADRYAAKGYKPLTASLSRAELQKAVERVVGAVRYWPARTEIVPDPNAKNRWIIMRKG